MKVLVVLTGELCFDGITNSVLNYYRAMDRSGMEIGIVSARGTNEEMRKNFEDIGCTVYPLENRDSCPAKYFVQLIGIIKRGKYDILHAHGNSATLAIETTAAYLAGCKVRIIHSRNSFCEHTKADKLLRPLMYATYTDGFSCGEKAGKWLFGNRPFTVMNNGKEINRFLFKPEVRKCYRKKLGVSADTILLGHVGLFHRQKNHPFLIDVFEEVCRHSGQYKLVLIGEGEDRGKIEEMVRQKGLTDKVIFLGRQSDVENWIQALDIMVFPSLFEGMPNVVLEWQLAGLPALISDVITKECGIMDTVSYLPLENGPAYWADQILHTPLNDRENTKEDIQKRFIEAGFDIKENAKVLKNKYIELLEKSK
jgi:glycosyltransferase involved in cell wall biosynthesis